MRDGAFSGRACLAGAVLVLPVAIALAFGASDPRWQALSLAAALFPLIAGLSGLKTAGLAAAYSVSLNLTHFLKRVVFLLGPQPQAVYFALQLLPTAILAVLCASAAREFRRRGLPASGKLLLTYLALAAATTLAPDPDMNWDSALASAHQQLLPLCLFFVGLSLTLDQFAKIGRWLALLAVLSVVYGLWQLVSGPTPIDRAWATETYAYSIHGGKVHAFLEGSSHEFRAFSYYADPLTWGLFLVAALLGAAVARALGRMSRLAWFGTFAAVLAGLFAGLTRTSWVGFLVTLGACWLLKGRLLRRTWLLFGFVLASFFLATLGGEYLYRELFLGHRLPVVDNMIASRYLTVGTVEARLSSFEALGQAAASAPLFGKGYGLLYEVARRLRDSPLQGVPSSHNFLVDIVLAVGVPGALLFLGFYLQWLREALAALKGTREEGHSHAVRWMIAFSVGFMITGYLNGMTFMTGEFFLILGVLAGHARKVSPEADFAVVQTPIQRWAPRVIGVEGGLGG